MFEAFLIISVIAIVWVLGLKVLGAVIRGFVNGVIGIFKHK